MHTQRCRLLIVDDSPEDRTIVRLLIEEANGRYWEFLEEEKALPALQRLENEEIDCILLDYNLPGVNGIRFLRELTSRFGDLRFPVVMFTGSGTAATAVAAMKAGAQDYLSKDNLRVDTLVRAIDNAMARIKLLREHDAQRQALEAANERLRMLEAAVQATQESILITDADLTAPGPRIVFVNPAFTSITGYPSEEVIGKSPRILQGPKTDRSVLDRLRADLTANRAFSGHTINYRKDGSEFVLNWAISPICGADGKPTHYVAVQREAAKFASSKNA